MMDKVERWRQHGVRCAAIMGKDSMSEEDVKGMIKWLCTLNTVLNGTFYQYLLISILAKFDAVIETGDKKDIGCEKKRDGSGPILLW